MNSSLDGSIFCIESESVEPHWMKYVEALHVSQSCMYVGTSHSVPVAYVPVSYTHLTLPTTPYV